MKQGEYIQWETGRHYEIPIPIEALQLDNSLLFGTSKDSSVIEQLADDFNAIHEQIKTMVKPRAGFYIFSDHVKVTDVELQCNGITFHAGGIICRALQHAAKIALFVVSIGKEAELYVHARMASADYLQGYFADILASAYTEACAVWIEEQFVAYAAMHNEQCSTRYSPGYCGWDIAEQKKLFSQLPNGLCGVQLTESSLMIPLKSISGLVGIGKHLERLEYQCEICDKTDCLRYKK